MLGSAATYLLASFLERHAKSKEMCCTTWNVQTFASFAPVISFESEVWPPVGVVRPDEIAIQHTPQQSQLDLADRIRTGGANKTWPSRTCEPKHPKNGWTLHVFLCYQESAAQVGTCSLVHRAAQWMIQILYLLSSPEKATWTHQECGKMMDFLLEMVTLHRPSDVSSASIPWSSVSLPSSHSRFCAQRLQSPNHRHCSERLFAWDAETGDISPSLPPGISKTSSKTATCKRVPFRSETSQWEFSMNGGFTKESHL